MSVATKSTSASTRSTLTRRRIAFSKTLTADKQLYIPPASLWNHGVTVQSAQTGNPVFAINHFEAVVAAQSRHWHGCVTEAIISEVDPATKKVGKILAIIRNEGIKFVVYTYFRAYTGQPVSFVDQDFYQGNMFRHGEMANSKKRCAFAVASRLTDNGKDFVSNVLGVAPVSSLSPLRRKEWTLDLRDATTKESQIVREVHVEAVTMRKGQNLLVATCLVYAAETIMNA